MQEEKSRAIAEIRDDIDNEAYARFKSDVRQALDDVTKYSERLRAAKKYLSELEYVAPSTVEVDF